MSPRLSRAAGVTRNCVPGYILSRCGNQRENDALPIVVIEALVAAIVVVVVVVVVVVEVLVVVVVHVVVVVVMTPVCILA